MILLALFLSAGVPASAQLTPQEPDPLARIRDAAKSNVQACSATGETLCEQVAPKIIANAEGDSPVAENVRNLAMHLNESDHSASQEVVARVGSMLRASGLEPRVEMNSIPIDGSPQTAVVAELRGREKPEEWVLIGANLNLDLNRPNWIRMACDVALVVEAARDIRRTDVKARRSIRFVVLIAPHGDRPGSWAYVRAHRDELDRARAAIFFDGGDNRIGQYNLSGRRDVGAGLREAMKPIESWRVFPYVEGASLYTGDFDFLLEGVQAINANQHATHLQKGPLDFIGQLDSVDVQELKRSTAVAAVTAFGIAERAEPLAPRQSRAEIESLLKASGLDEQMRTSGVWPLWQSGQRGRMP